MLTFSTARVVILVRRAGFFKAIERSVMDDSKIATTDRKESGKARIELCSGWLTAISGYNKVGTAGAHYYWHPGDRAVGG